MEKVLTFFKENWKITLIIIGVIFLLLFFCFFGKISDYFFENNKTQGELLKVFLTAIAGIVAVFVWHTGYKRVKVMEKQTEKTAEQIQVMYKENVDTRFNNAVGHLGNEKHSIILGGIHALHEIAVENKNYRQIVHNIFCSYIRENSAKLYEKVDFEKMPDYCPVIIQTLIDYLFQPYNYEDSVYKDFESDLSFSTLKNCDFSNVKIKNVNFRNCVLESCYFAAGTLTECDFDYGTLTECSFSDGTLTNCSFSAGTLTECSFYDGTLTNCYFYTGTLTECSCYVGTLTNCHFYAVTLTNYEFSDVTLTKCSFSDVTLTKCEFNEGALKSCNFYAVTLTNCSFYAVTLTNCSFYDVTLTECKFNEGALESCNFYRTKLNNCDFEYTKLINTELPPNENKQKNNNI